MDTLNHRVNDVLCERHRIKITTLNIGENFSLNRRTLCSQCLNVEKSV